MNYPKNKSYDGVPLGYKRCCKCGKVQPLSCFSSRNGTPDGKRYDCKTCKKSRKKHQISGTFEDRRGKRLKKNYGLTSTEYDKLYQDQHGKCAICGVHQSALNKPLFVDHDHITGKVRGLLCRNCNAGIGYLGDSLGNLTQAIKYLSRYGKKR